MRSILSLPPALQAAWTAVYAAALPVCIAHEKAIRPGLGLAGPRERDAVDPLQWAEFHAWEAVRRANGGEMPEVPGKTDDKTWKRSAMQEALLWFADEGHDVGLPRHQTGVEKAREALGIPCRYEDGSIMPLAEAVALGAAIGADVDEPTDEEMVEALAPIVAELSNDAVTWAHNKPFHEAWIDQARLCMLGQPSTWTRAFRSQCAIALASWKAARARGRK